MLPEKFGLNKIQNRLQSVIIYFDIADIWQTVLVSWIITTKHNMWFQGEM